MPRITSLACILLVMIFFVTPVKSEMKNKDLIRSLGAVPRKDIGGESSAFSTIQEYLQSVASARRPVVITGYDVNLSDWDLDVLASNGDSGLTLDNVRRIKDKSGEMKLELKFVSSPVFFQTT